MFLRLGILFSYTLCHFSDPVGVKSRQLETLIATPSLGNHVLVLKKGSLHLLAQTVVRG